MFVCALCVCVVCVCVCAPSYGIAVRPTKLHTADTYATLPMPSAMGAPGGGGGGGGGGGTPGVI